MLPAIGRSRMAYLHRRNGFYKVKIVYTVFCEKVMVGPRSYHDCDLLFGSMLEQNARLQRSKVWWRLVRGFVTL